MTNFASNIKIQNFKSIRDLELNDCKRINLFIGKPNVGKSNILEALSLFSLPYFGNINLKSFIRFESISELYFDGDTTSPINIDIDKNNSNINYLFDFLSIKVKNKTRKILYYHNGATQSKDEIIDKKSEYYPYKSYLFPKKMEFHISIADFLYPIDGANLFETIQSNKDLKIELSKIFQTYGLNLVFDKSSQEFKVMKGVEKGEIFLIPFSSIADSLQRLIFYKTAIKSNKNSVITFEEPEAHTYPPYIAQIAQDIIEADSNQFFITTHSPYVVNEFLENAQKELCIFLIDFKDGETVARRLTDKELDEVYNDGIEE